MRQAGATLHRGARASHYRGLSCCGAQAPDAQAQYLWLTGPATARHVGSYQTRARTRVPCIGRQILNHCATREATVFVFILSLNFVLMGLKFCDRFLVKLFPLKSTDIKTNNLKLQHTHPIKMAHKTFSFPSEAFRKHCYHNQPFTIKLFFFFFF